MWTGLILACLASDPTTCVVASSQAPYLSKEECVADIPQGLAFVDQRYPGTVVVEIQCYEWEYSPPNI